MDEKVKLGVRDMRDIYGRISRIVYEYDKSSLNKDMLERLIRSDLSRDNIEANVSFEGIYLCVYPQYIDGEKRSNDSYFRFILNSRAKRVLEETIREFMNDYFKGKPKEQLDHTDIYFLQEDLKSYLSQRLNIDKDSLDIYKYFGENVIAVSLYPTNVKVEVRL